jgi:hypothetical protein
MKNKWRVSGSQYKISETSTEIELLPVAIYKLEMSIFGPYLNRLEDKFTLPEKIYGHDKHLVKRVVKTYKNTSTNLGVLLNGLKGTGKSLTSKMICNELGLPVIIVDNPFGGSTADFILEMPDDAIFFFDEYEKNFKKDDKGNPDHTILTVMDGALATTSRRVFLLTTNDPYVNENMLQRPGRIRYYKTFEDLGKDVVMEIVEDKLLFPELKKETVDFISKLKIISMDIVNAVIDEVNIHEESPVAFKDVFNVEEMDDVFNVYEIEEDGERKLYKLKADVYPSAILSGDEGSDFRVDGHDLGEIKEVIKGVGYKVNCRVAGAKGWEYKDKIFLLERTYATHQAFYGYAF